MIALAVASIAVAGTASAADIYKSENGDTSLSMTGRAEARMSIRDGETQDESRIRLRFTGKTQVSDGLYAVGAYEGEFHPSDDGRATDSGDSDDELINRYMYAGLGGTYGEITYGKNDGALGVITDFTDIMAYHGNSAAYKLNVADRADNMIAYKGSFGDFDLRATYRFSDREESRNENGELEYSNNSRNGYSASAIWNVSDTGLRLALAYAQQDIEVERIVGGTKDDDQNEFMAAASWEYNNFYTAINYVTGEAAAYSTYMSESDGPNIVFGDVFDVDGYEWAGAYTWNKAVFTATYNYQEVEDEAYVNNAAIDVSYYFVPNFRAYASYNFNMLDSSDLDAFDDSKFRGQVSKPNKDDEIALGLRYDF